MKIAAIITEYNPFHNGHQYQIDKTRELLGEDTAIIAIMSGNFTQRGELAIADKTVRSKAAVECGVNLVLELPFPFSMSSAEFFARSGVKIASSIGIVDYLVFGSELGDIDTLTSIAKNMLSEEFSKKTDELIRSSENKSAGHPKILEEAYNSLYSESLSEDFFSSNNILALEYIKALIIENSPIIPLTVKREGADYNDGLIANSSYQSATAIRALMRENDNSAFDYIPENAKNVFLSAMKANKLPADPSVLDTAVISHFRLNPPKASQEIHDAAGGLYNRLYAKSLEANSISSLISLVETKKYTKARIRRALLNSYLGVTSSVVRELPAYTQVLAMDDIGRQVLKRIKKMSDFPVITKPSSYSDHTTQVISQYELSARADSVFAMTLKEPNLALFALTFTPYVKK